MRAVDDGAVVIARSGWKQGDSLKGGNYVVLLLAGGKELAYYAHLETIAVKPGDEVKRGDVLGTVGRTGLNACRRDRRRTCTSRSGRRRGWCR